MNNFHRFQNVGQISNVFFANLIEKETHVTLFWNLSRNPDNISSKIRSKMQGSTQKMEKIGKSLFIREKMLTIFG